MRGCVSSAEAGTFCRATIVDEDKTEQMRVFCCRSSDYCNMNLIKSKTNWNDFENITDTQNKKNISITTLFGSKFLI